ncbi:MAG: phage portal protein [Terriglobales bacterium]
MEELTLLNLGGAAEIANAIDRANAKPEILAKAKQSLLPALWGMVATNDPEDATFHRITAPNARRDLNPLMQERMQAVCYYLSVTNPFAKRIVEVITSYVVGEGFTAAAKDKNTQEVVDDFWNDAANNLDLNLRSWSEELSRFGELCLPVAVNEVDGSVRLGYVDPLDIAAIEYGALDASGDMQFMSMPIAVRLKKRVGESDERRLAIIRPDEDPNSPMFGRLAGDCFYFTVNKAKGGTRGFSDLFALADWADVFDAMVFDFADRARFLNAYVWDYTLTGADEELVNKWRDRVTKSPPKQGGVQVHNEQVKIEAITPDLKGADMAQAATLVRNYGLGGAGLPTWFFADGSDTNRATASEMTGPTGKKFTDRQNEVKSLVTMVIAFVLDQAQQHGVLGANADLSFELQVPDLMVKDIAQAATTMGALTNSLSIAEQNGWVTSETAARAFHVVLSQIGVTVDSKAEFEAAQIEMEQRLARQINQFVPQRSLAFDLLNQDQGGNKKTPGIDPNAAAAPPAKVQ